MKRRLVQRMGAAVIAQVQAEHVVTGIKKVAGGFAQIDRIMAALPTVDQYDQAAGASRLG